MSEMVTAGLISVGGPVIVGVTALLLNFRLFGRMKKRIEAIERDLKQNGALVGPSVKPR